MSLRETAERATLKAINECKARIESILKKCKAEKNRLRLIILFPEQHKEVERLTARIEWLMSGHLAFEMLDEISSTAETGFKRIRQLREFGKRAGQERRKVPKWEKEVESAIKEIRAKRKRAISQRALAREVVRKLRLPQSEFETVRKRVQKMVGK